MNISKKYQKAADITLGILTALVIICAIFFVGVLFNKLHLAL
jgi:hypothetical protein